MMRTIQLAVACVTVLVSAALLQTTDAAVITTFTDRGSFDAAVGPTSQENFNSFVSETPFHSTPLDVGDFTLSMTGSAVTERNFIDIPPTQFSAFNVDNTTVANVLTQLGVSLFMTFDSPLFAFGADFAAFNGVIPQTSVVVNGEVLLPPVTAADQVRFFGFSSDIAFTTVEFRGITNDGYGIDNVSFTSVNVAAVPEPASLAIFGIGACVMSFGRRRRRR